MLSVYDQISERLTSSEEPLVTRFAPSPTGYLHLGHVLSAIYVWGIGKLFNIKINLRIEDHDRGRSRADYIDSIFADLEWLELYPDNTIRRKPLSIPSSYMQSSNHTRYQETLQKLTSTVHVYACTCTRSQILASAHDQAVLNELYYPGHCRSKQHPFTKECGIRLELPGDEITFFDLYSGWQKQQPSRQCGDLLLRDKHGNWTYQFAVVNDDIAEHINVTIRGQDLLASTGRQILLRRMLNTTDSMMYFHHPLLEDQNGRKLSKRFFSEGVSQQRLQGIAASTVLGQACHLGGIIKDARPVQAQELPLLLKDYLKELSYERA